MVVKIISRLDDGERCGGFLRGSVLGDNRLMVCEILGNMSGYLILVETLVPQSFKF